MPTSKWQVRELSFASGERYAALVDSRTGIPDFDVSRYTLTQLRPRNLAAATIAAATRAIKFGLEILDLMGVDIDQRIHEGRLLELHEVDRLVQLSSWTQEELNEALKNKDKPAVLKKVQSLEAVRKRASNKHTPAVVLAKTAEVRLLYFRDFLSWKVDSSLSSRAMISKIKVALRESRESLVKWITARLPKVRNGDSDDAPQGLLGEEIDQLLMMIEPDSKLNPWKSETAKIRNKLIIQTLINLGLRKGELLNLKVSDIDFRKNQLSVMRRPDDPEDVRKKKPQVKTRARVLDLGPELARGLHMYVVKYRSRIQGARFHPYFFVANGTGKALSISAVDKIFAELRDAALVSFEKLTPHILRHTWNTRFSELMDERGIAESIEQDERSYAMGWTPGSGTGRTYLRRHTRKKANEASLLLQERLKR